MRREDRFKPFIGVDLDGTLASYNGWVAWNIIGPPIVPMVLRIREWLIADKQVAIFTARCAHESDWCRVTNYVFKRREVQEVVQKWIDDHEIFPGWRPLITATKYPNMVEFWDDRAVQVVPNTGFSLTDAHTAELTALRGKSFQSPTVGEEK